MRYRRRRRWLTDPLMPCPNTQIGRNSVLFGSLISESGDGAGPQLRSLHVSERLRCLSGLHEFGA